MIIGSAKKRRELQGNINITPFTDVILVLLIVFMISAPGMILSSFQIQLPGASGQKRGHYDLTVGLSKDGSLYVNGQEIERSDLTKQLENLPKSSQKRILLNADSRAGYGQVIDLIELMRKSGAESVFAGTIPAEQSH